MESTPEAGAQDRTHVTYYLRGLHHYCVEENGKPVSNCRAAIGIAKNSASKRVRPKQYAKGERSWHTRDTRSFLPTVTSLHL